MAAVIPAKAGIQRLFCVERHWVPAFAGTTDVHSISELSPRQLDEQVLEVRRPVQVANARRVRKRVEQRLRVERVAERRLAGELDPLGQRATLRVAPGARIVAV